MTYKTTKTLADLSHIVTFLGCNTPVEWCVQAVKNLPTLLIDHAHCEKKAASTALAMLFRYPQHEELVYSLSRVAREELRHFEQVIAILKKRRVVYQNLKPARYAEGMISSATTFEPKRLVDLLIISAFIEARSCERFAMLYTYLDEELKNFYAGLLLSEGRHYQLYLKFAKKYADFDITDRVAYFRHLENSLILTTDEQFRFHSGLPID